MTDLVFLGEAWGEQEEFERTAFVGAAGYELTRMLEEVGIKRADCFFTNVFNLRPNGNKIETLCGKKENGIKGYPFLKKGFYVDERYTSELERLGDELIENNPNLIVALGNTPS